MIPAFNEENLIGATVETLKQTERPIRVIVVDDGSSDKTGEIARQAGAEVISFSKNIGKGTALRQALGGVDIARYAAVAFIDADVGRTASQIDKLLTPVLEGKADMSIGILPSPSKKGGFGLVKSLASRGIARLTGYSTRAPLSGQRAMRPTLLNDVVIANGFGMEVGLTIDALWKGYRIVEVPVAMTHAATGRDWQGFVHRGKQFTSVLVVLFRHFLAKRNSDEK